MATLISSVPKFSTPEEHKSLVGSTPSSFAEIPSVLRHKQENVTVSFDPPLDGFSDDDRQGTLYVIESALVFMATTGRGFLVEYPHITLHAVSRSDNGPPSVYCQLEDPIADMETPADDDVGDLSMRELTIIPQDQASLDDIFEALSVCASLHPDELPDESDEEGDDAFVDPDALLNGQFETFDGSDEQELSEVGKAALAHLESIIDHPLDPKPEDAWEDADEDTQQKVAEK